MCSSVSVVFFMSYNRNTFIPFIVIYHPLIQANNTLTTGQSDKMQKKQTDFDNWVKEVTMTWKHVESLKGKQTRRNLGILRIIFEAYYSLSMWELALEYLKLTQPDFNSWHNDRVFHERQKENAQMSRRLKFLLEKEYVRKEGAQYRLGFKGFLLMLILDPKLAAEKGRYCEEDVISDIGQDNLPTIDFPEDPFSNEDFVANATRFMEVLKDEAMAAGVSAAMKRKLFGWKVNLDEISSRELIGLFLSQTKRGLKNQV